MALNVGEIEAVLKARDEMSGTVKSASAQINSAMAGLTNAFKAPGQSFAALTTSLVAGYATFAGVTMAGKALVSFLTDSVKEFAAAEAASRKLDTALKAQ